MEMNWTTPANPVFCNITAIAETVGLVSNTSMINVSLKYQCGMNITNDFTMTTDICIKQ